MRVIRLDDVIEKYKWIDGKCGKSKVSGIFVSAKDIEKIPVFIIDEQRTYINAPQYDMNNIKNYHNRNRLIKN